MATAKLFGVVTQLVHADPEKAGADAELLSRFIARRDEIAFAELVRRHGRLVFGVCRRVTGNHHLAEDAFQAVFVVLATKPGAIRPPAAVGAWLHGVAVRTALRARTMSDRRRRREIAVGTLPELDTPVRAEATDAVALLDEEIAGLPDRLRTAVVLCELEGVCRKDASARLGIREGTLSSRLAAARKALAARLRRRGVALSAGGLSAALAQTATAAPSAALAARAMAAATPQLVPPAVGILSNGVLRIMLLDKLKTIALFALVSVGLAACAVVVAASIPPDATPPARPAAVSLVLVAGGEPIAARDDAKPLPRGPNRLLVWRKGALVITDPEAKTEKTVLTQKGGIHPHMFALSPDGTRVAVVQPSKDEDNAPVHLFVFELGKEDSGIDLGPAGIAHWSGDGKELVVCQYTDGKKAEDVRTTCEIVTLATKKRVPVKVPDTHMLLDWSRDGRFFLTMKIGVDRNKPFVATYLLNRDGSEYKQLTDEKTLAAFAKLSPDGTRVLFLHPKFKEETAAEQRALQDAGGRDPRPTHHELKVIDVASGKITPVADVPLNGELQGFCWSPNGKQIAYTWREVHEGDPKDLLEKETHSHLVVSDPDGKNQKTILSEKGAGQSHMTLAGVDWR
jgi:RNA polymerase sigma factor (sigma-70 family)